jgi:hypothetical protein
MSRLPASTLFGVLALLVACGATTKHTPGDGSSGQGAGGASRGGFSGSSSSGATNGGGMGGVSGRGNGGGAAGGEPSPGGAGQGGSSGQSSSDDCQTEYSGPLGGPRLDGPMPIGSCDLIADELILARYKDFDARVPEGSYYEPAGPIVFWGPPCSVTLAETVRRSGLEQLGTPENQFETEWFYEATSCQNGVRRAYRNLRCDYFDGTKLSAPSVERLAFLGSLLWWSTHYNSSGSALLGYSIAIGDATEWVEFCTISTVGGDFGLCDEITLESTTHSLTYDGTVKLGEPTTVRTLKGDCH